MEQYLCILLVVLATSEAAIDADLVTSLPGLAKQPSFKHYSGYLKATGGRQLHYWFVESQGNASSDPLVVWLNGGPGCSSLDGLLSEHGPFLANEDGTALRENPYAWNKVANILYLEAPAGVGYSYSPDQNYTTSDDQTSLDNLWALKYFMNHYPEFAGNEFFITGESYGGIYVPTLAARVVDDKDFNFKGFAVGNGLSSVELNGDSIIYYGYYHGLWGQTLWNELVGYCCKNANSSDCAFSTSRDPRCQNSVNTAGMIIFSLNIYNLFAECYQANTSTKSLFHPLYNMMFPLNVPLRTQKKKLQSLPKTEVSLVPPCIDATGMTRYLNRDDVRTSIHIPKKLPNWEICSEVVEYKRIYSNMTQQYHKILATKKQRILVYNGDADMACNFLGDEWFVDSLQQKPTDSWKSWFYTSKDGSQQVAGFVKPYENINFVTVKGAGHMVPQNKPKQALVMFTKFIKGQSF